MNKPPINIKCIKCNKPVDYWKVVKEFACGSIQLVASCHGETKKYLVNPDTDLQEPQA